jgi:hypothetical protein
MDALSGFAADLTPATLTQAEDIEVKREAI